MDIKEVIRLTKKNHNDIDNYYLSSKIARILDTYNDDDDNIDYNDDEISCLNQIWNDKYKYIYTNFNMKGHFLYRGDYDDTDTYYDNSYLCKLYFGENVPDKDEQEKICDKNEKTVLNYPETESYLFESLIDHISIKILTFEDVYIDDFDLGKYHEYNIILKNFGETKEKWKEYYNYVKNRYGILKLSHNFKLTA
jgi:hypothetical protein